VGSKDELINYAISEHVEDAGGHSGNATLLMPAQHLRFDARHREMHIAVALCHPLWISGPFNLQSIALDSTSSAQRFMRVIEVNARPSCAVHLISETFPSNW